MMAFWVFVVCLLISAISFISLGVEGRKLKRYEREYNKALQGTDKFAAIEWGRKYYAAKSETGRMRNSDEQALANDIAAMKTN